MAAALHLPTEHALGRRRAAHLVRGARARHAHALEHIAQVALCVREASVSGWGGGTGSAGSGGRGKGRGRGGKKRMNETEKEWGRGREREEGEGERERQAGNIDKKTDRE